MIQNIDIIIVLIYFVVILFIGLWAAQKSKTSDDLFLGGRTFGWGLIGLSLFASNVSGTTIIGLFGASYHTGIVQSSYEWMSGLSLIIAALIFIPLYLKSKITTIPEFLELRYDRRSRLFFSFVTIFISLIVDTAGSLYAGAILLNAIIPTLPLWQTTLFLAGVAGVYTAWGGLKAVVITDAIQAIVLIVGCSVLTYLLYEELDFSWSNVVQNAPEEHFSLIRPADDDAMPWVGLIFGVPILGFWYWCTNQYIMQRVLGARSISHARWGVMLAGFLKIIPVFVMVLPGIMAISLFPELSNPDSVFPTAVMNVLPVGFVGLVLAGFISAILSSVDSTLNSASTLIVLDFIQTKNRVLTERQKTKYSRIATIILVVFAAFWAPQITNFGGLWLYLQQIFAIVVPPIVVIFFVGIFYKKGNGDGAFWTLILGTLAGTSLFLLSLINIWTLHFTVNVGVMVVFSTLIFIMFSQISVQNKPENIKTLLYKPDLMLPTQPYPWYKDYRFYSVLMMLAMLAILIVFW